VRLLGLSVPEVVAGEATEFTRKTLSSTNISLTLDKRRVDSHGRTLAYVHFQDECFNVELVRRGLAYVAPYPGDSATMLRELYRAQDAAQEEQCGLWSKGGRSENAVSRLKVADTLDQSND
jgi:endonuclease YncB( thermonuclease family)